jgi:hypothetical protein
MAKSLRSKTKRAFRAKKREDGVYAVAHAARLHRLHEKIDAIIAAPKPVRDEILEDAENAEGDGEVQEEEMAGACQLPHYITSTRISWRPSLIYKCASFR